MNYISEEIFQELYNDTEEAAKMIAAFIEYLNIASVKGNKFKNRISGKN